MRMDELARPAIDVVRARPDQDPPASRSSAATSSGWRTSGRGASRASCGGATRSPSGTAARTSATAASSRRRARGGSATPTCSTPGSRAALWPFATLGWPEDTAGAARVLPDRRALDGARHPVPVGRADGHAGPALPRRRSRSSTSTSTRSSRRPTGAGCRSRSAPASTRSTSSSREYGADGATRALRPAGDVLHAGRALQRGEDRARARSSTNKLFNASRLILMNAPERVEPAARPTTVEDRWILSRLQRAKAEAAERIGAFDFSKLALGLYDFVFSELCDWYLELVKPRLYDGDADAQATRAARAAETLALAHPVIPFVTEELWSMLPGERGLLAASRMPAARRVAASTPRRRAGRRRAIDADPRAAQLARVGRRRGRGSSIRGALDGRRRRADGAAHRAAWRASSGRRTATSRVATVPVPGGAVDVLATEGLDLGAAERKRDAERERARGRDRARRGQARQRGLRRQGAAGRSSRPSGRSSSGCGRSSRRCDPARRGPPREDAERWLLDRELFGMRFGLDRMRRLLTALGSPQERVPLDPRRRDERQVVDGADDRGDPRAPRRAHRRVPLAAPRLVPRAHPHRRRGPAAEGLRARDRRASRARPRRSTARSRPATASRSSRRSPPRRTPSSRGRASRSRSSRPGSAGAGTRRTSSPSEVAGPDERRPRAHALARPDGARHRAREARGGAARARRSCSAPACTPTRSTRPRGTPGRRGSSPRRPTPTSSSARRARSSGATSRSRGPPPRRCSGRSTTDAVREAAAAVRVPGPLRGRRTTSR